MTGAPALSRFVRLAAVLLAGTVIAGCNSADQLTPGLQTSATDITGASQGTSRDSGFQSPFADGTSTSLGAREVMQNPSVAEIMKPAGSLPEMVMGKDNAPVTVIKYASMTCPYCRKFQAEVFPHLKREYIDTGKVRFIIREFPIGFQSGMATVALRCAPAEKRFQLYDRLMAQQAVWVSQEVRTEPIQKVSAQVGLTAAQFEACRNDKALIRDLNAVKERGRTLGIVGTPNFFINGRLIKSPS